MKNSINENVKASLSVSGDNHIEVQGILNFDSVPVLMKKAEAVLAGLSDAKVNFSEVTESNSAGLALIFELKRFMQSKNKSIVFSGLPEQIRSVAKAYGIETELESCLE